MQGKVDLPLNHAGRQEAQKNIAHIRLLSVTRVVSSNKKRALQTAEIYSKSLGIPVEVSPSLRELDHGRWEGQRIEDLIADCASGFAGWLDDPTSVKIPDGTESVTVAQQRILQGMCQIAKTSGKDCVLVLTHKHICALLMCALHSVSLNRFRQMIDDSVVPRMLPQKIVSYLCANSTED